MCSQADDPSMHDAPTDLLPRPHRWGNRPLCEVCFHWFRPDIQMPVRLRDPLLETCFVCQRPTRYGAYVRAPMPDEKVTA